MAYHSEVLQKERDMLRKSRLSSPTSPEREQKEQGNESDSSGVRRAGGGSHRFTAMAEAALAQVRGQGQGGALLFCASPFCRRVSACCDACLCSVVSLPCTRSFQDDRLEYQPPAW